MGAGERVSSEPLQSRAPVARAAPLQSVSPVASRVAYDPARVQTRTSREAEVKPEQDPAEAEAEAELVAESVLKAVLRAIDRREPRALVAALGGLTPASRERLLRGEPTLRSRLLAYEATRYWLNYDDRVEALALLSGEALAASHVALAVGLARRPDQLVRSLLAVGSRATRGRVEERYDATFADLFGADGTLTRHLRFYLKAYLQASGVWREVAAVMDHEYGPADRLYFAASGDSPLAAVALLNALWAQGAGLGALAAAEREWGRFITSTAGWTRQDWRPSEPWVRLPRAERHPLRAGLDELLGGDAWREAKLYLDEFVAAEDAGPAGAPDVATLQVQIPKYLESQVHLAIVALRSLTFAQIVELKARLLAQNYSLVDRVKRIARGSPRSTEPLGLLALLVSGREYDPYARLAIAVNVEGDVTHAHEVLYGLDDGGRATLHAHYQLAYSDTQPGDDQLDAARVHVKTRFGPDDDWKAEKTLALLDRGLTEADELYFVSEGNRRPDHARTAALLEKVGTDGAHFARLAKEWDQSVRTSRRWRDGAPWSRLPLVEAVSLTLSNDRASRVARAVLDAHAEAESRDRRLGLTREKTPSDLAGVDVRLRIAVPVFAAVRGGAGGAALVGPVTEIARLLARRRELSVTAGDFLITSQIAERVRAQIKESTRGSTRTRLLLLVYRGGTLNHADELSLILDQNGTSEYTPEIAAKVLERVTLAWAAGAEKELREDKEVRDGYGVDRVRAAIVDLRRDEGLVRKASSEAQQRFELAALMLAEGRSRVEIGAERLRRELQGTLRSHANDDLRGALAFIKALTVQERGEIVAAYAAGLGAPPGVADTPAGRLVYAIRSQHETSRWLLELEDLVRGPTTEIQQDAARGRQREQARHTGLLSGVSHALQAIREYDSDRRPGALAARSLAYLQRIAEDEKNQPEVLAGGVAQARQASGKDLSGRELEAFKAYEAEDAARRKELAETISLVIEVGGRSALVALTGPVGLAGLTSALVAISLSYATSEALLGADYDAVTVKNAANLASEVTGSIYEKLGVEKLFGGLVEKVTRSRLGERLLARGLADPLTIEARTRKVETLATTVLSTLASDVFDGIAERVVAGTGAPSVSRGVGKVGAATLQGAGKVLALPVSDRLTVFAPLAQFWGLQTVKVLINGPPPKASMARAVLSAMIKLVEDPNVGEITVELAGQKVREAITAALLSSLSVGLAFTVVKQREAGEALERFIKDPSRLEAKIRGDRSLFSRYTRDQEAAAAAGRERQEPLAWAFFAANDATHPDRVAIARGVSKLLEDKK